MDLKKIDKSFKDGNLVYRLVTEMLRAVGYSNRNIAGLQIKNKVYKYIVKKYSYLVNNNIQLEKKSEDNKTIWICWFQGIDNAPSLVKNCVKSIKNKMPDYEIVLIDKKNMLEYVKFPDYILKKWSNGIIKDALMSDLLRMNLLIDFGGIWMDATVYLSDRIPKVIETSSFFVFKHTDINDLTVQYNNWFIKSNKNNEVLINVRDILYTYWKNENKVKEYFIWHLVMTMVMNSNPDLYNKIPYISDDLPEHLANNINNEYDEEYWSFITNSCSIHKLSYKIKREKLSYVSYYDKLMG